MTITIRPYAEGDEVHACVLGGIYSPHAATTPDEVKANRDKHLKEPKYRRETFFAFAGDRLLGSMMYAQHAYPYHPELYCLHSRLNAGVPFSACGPLLYERVLGELAPFAPKKLQAWARVTETGFVTFLAGEGFRELNRTAHMVLDVAMAPVAADLLPAGIRIASLAELAADPMHLEKLYKLEVATVADIPFGQVGEAPSFASFTARISESARLKWRGILIAVEGSRFVGFTYLFQAGRSSALYLGGTGVDRRYRGRGIAKALKQRSVAYAREHGFTSLHSDNHLPNKAIIATNHSVGFAIRWEELELEKRL